MTATLQQPVAFNPDQPRDPDGKWGDGLGHILAKAMQFADGEMTVAAQRDGLHLQFGDSDSGGLDLDTAWQLCHAIEADNDEGPFPRKRTFVSYPPGDRNAPPTGFVELTQTGPGQYEMELLNNDHRFALTSSEAKQLPDVVRRYSTASRVNTETGPLDVFVTEDDQYALRLHNRGGDAVDLRFDEASWTRMRSAIDVVYEGFDESSKFGHDPGDDVDELRIPSSMGELVVHRTGPSLADDPKGNPTLQVAAADGSWRIAFPSSDDAVWEAFQNVEFFGEHRGFHNCAGGRRGGVLASRGRRREGDMNLDDIKAGDAAGDQLAAFRARMRRPVARQGHAWYRIDNSAAGEAEIFLFDEIGFWGTSADEFVAELKAIAAPRITVRINSPGGDVADGLAIYDALRAHPAHITTRVAGLAASAASFIFQAGDRRVTARNGILMIHDAIGLCYGNPAETHEYADLLGKLSDNIADIYAQHGGGDVAAWRALMTAETWYTGAEAVAAGLADEMTDPDPQPQDAPPEMRNTWDLTIFRYAGRDQAPEPGVARAANAAVGSGGEPGADAAGGAVEPPPEPTPEPAPAAPEPPAEPVVDDTPAPLVPDPPADTTQDDWADIVAQLETAPSTVDDALVRLREA